MFYPRRGFSPNFLQSFFLGNKRCFSQVQTQILAETENVYKEEIRMGQFFKALKNSRRGNQLLQEAPCACYTNEEELKVELVGEAEKVISFKKRLLSFYNHSQISNFFFQKKQLSAIFSFNVLEIILIFL